MVSFACDIIENNEITKFSLLVLFWGFFCLLLSDGGSSYFMLISNSQAFMCMESLFE